MCFVSLPVTRFGIARALTYCTVHNQRSIHHTQYVIFHYNEGMLLILTHENADFDAVASQFAAYKLYPHGIPLLPRRINRNVDQFLTLYWNKLPYVRPEDWRKRRVEELLLVDTQAPLSVRGLCKRPQVHVIDHHIGHEPKEGWHYQVEPVGATTTLLVEKLQANGLTLLFMEATLLLLGIYEDTGSLTYDTTTSRDAQAAAWLLEQGAQLSIARRFLNIPLTPEQQELYKQLQAQATWVKVEGRRIVVLATAVPATFTDEISSVVHRLREALLPDALVALVQIGRDVQLVARSQEDHVDVSLLARAFGGGGHSRAAAALIAKHELEAVKERVLALLPQAVKPLDTVAQIMSYGVQIVAADMPVAEAAVLMQRVGYEGYPVVDPETGQLVGLLTRRAVDRAVNHDMARFPIQRIMKAGAVTVSPTDSIERLQQIMLEEGWGQVPVVMAEQAPGLQPIVGIVTRTDLLNYLFQPTMTAGEPEIRELLQQSLAVGMWQMVLAISAAADTLNMPLYFVGGLVRDVLLNKTPKDLDMVVEGDAIRLVQTLQQQFGGQVHAHRRFGTAKWFTTTAVWRAVMQDGQNRETAAASTPMPITTLPESIDFVTARTEFYREPSALPDVERGSIKLDLHRRDFTINTLAVRLDGAHLGELLDFYGGRRDLEQGMIRVLHSLSFVDDPTRMLRAARLEQRLRFMIESRTAELLLDALPMLDRVTGDRIRREIELALREPAPARILARLHDLNILAQIHPQLAWLPQAAVSYARVPALIADPAWGEALQGESAAFIYFALWLALLPTEAQVAVMKRLRVRKATRLDMTAVTELRQALTTLPNDARPSVVAQTLRPYQPRVLLVGRAMLEDGETAALLERYYREWRHVKTAVNGDDLRAMKLKPGPEFGRWLDQLLAARLDGEVHTRAEEMALLQELIHSA